MSGFDVFLTHYGLVAVFSFMLIKTIGVPVPIPGDLIILTAAVRVAQGKLVGWQVFLAILVALLLGGSIQFVLARGPGRGLLSRFGRYVGLTPPRIDGAAQKIRKGGVPGLAISILVPGVRGGAIPARPDTGKPPVPQSALFPRLSGGIGSLCPGTRSTLVDQYPPGERAAGSR